jgi:hypothetical protein
MDDFSFGPCLELSSGVGVLGVFLSAAVLLIADVLGLFAPDPLNDPTREEQRVDFLVSAALAVIGL